MEVGRFTAIYTNVSFYQSFDLFLLKTEDPHTQNDFVDTRTLPDGFGLLRPVLLVSTAAGSEKNTESVIPKF